MTERNEHHTFKADEIPCQEISNPAVLSKNPLVSVHMITYNHELYIAQAIEGVLIQETDFPIELVIGEDCSIDRTREIVLEYQKKYPEIIRVITSDGNIGAQKNSLRTQKTCRGKYIALCEGDDYWTAPNKLAKQVSFLEKYREYSACFHYVVTVDSQGKILSRPTTAQTHIFTQRNIFGTGQRPTPTCSMVYRRDCVPKVMPEWFLKVFRGDHFLKMLLTEEHDLFVLDEIMACYRVHNGGILSSLPWKEKKVTKKRDNDILIGEFGSKYPDLVDYVRDFPDYYFSGNGTSFGEKIRDIIVILRMFKYPRFAHRNYKNILLKIIKCCLPDVVVRYVRNLKLKRC